MASGDLVHRLVLSGTRLNGDDIPPFDKSFTDTSISDIEYRAVINIGTTVQTVITVGTAAGATLAALNRLIVHNEDSSNFVQVGLLSSGKSIYLKVKPGETMSIDPSVIECDDDAAGAFSAFSSVTSVTLDADTAACKCLVMAW